MKRLFNGMRRTGLWRQSAVTMLVTAYMGLALVPAAQASDTEVYARKMAIATELAPTLMMMLDSSGSMGDCLTYSGSTCVQTRIQAMLSAMQKVLYGNVAESVKPIPGFVRLGYARYNPDANKGGWVKYPARPLDAFVDINPNGFVESTILASNSDAEQVSGTLNITSPELDLGLGDVGLQFQTLNVPKGASINEAYIEFTANRDSSASPAIWEVDVQDIGDAPVFTTGSGDIDSRTFASAVAVEKITDKWLQNQKYQLNVLTPIQHVVNRSDWCGGNAAVLRIRRTSGSAEDRYAYSYDGNAALSPRLVVNYSIDPKSTGSCIKAPFTSQARLQVERDDIEYTEGASGSNALRNSSTLEFAYVASSKRNQVAMRFAGFDRDIYKNATITEATIVATGYKNVSNVPVLEVAAFDVDNLAPFTCSSSTKCTIPTAAVTAAQTWSLPGNRVVASTLHAVPVTALVQGLVNRPAWAAGNAMGFRLRSNVTNKSSDAAFLSYEGASPSARPVLVVKGTQKFTDLSKLKTVRDDIWAELQGMPIGGGTPLGAAYVESMRYMLGQPVFAPDVDSRVIDPTSSPIAYQSPVKVSSQCAGNYVFALTDGEPNNLAQVGTNTKEIIGQTCPSSYSSYVYGTSQQENWRCMLAAAEWGLKPTNQIKSRIRTNTVLFGEDDVNTTGNMRQVAKFGGGTFYKSGDEASLVKALTDTVNALLDVSGTITAPGVAVNQLNRLNNLDQLFYAVFDPDVQRAYWPGNVKRYRLDIDNEDVKDVNELSAVDTATSFFKSTAKSWWSPAVDGDKARLGGAASVLPDPATRNLFTFTGGLPSGSTSLTDVNLSNGSFVSAGKSLTGITDDAEFSNLINWYKGYQINSLKDGLVSVDSTTLRRQEIGGALHSRPILVSYGYSGTPEQAAADPNLQDNTLFFSTLEGTLHAVDAKTGEEYFGFIPGEKLAVLPTLYANPAQENPEFGMDLTWTVQSRDSNGDGTPDKVYIYGGMRMGGSNYYALDVTDRTSPRLLFAIKGGSGSFGKLGQTWSQPALTAMRVNGAVVRVLVFGGGYDAQHETENTVFAGDSVGNAIYIVNAETGDLIAEVDSGNNGDMQFAIPSQPKTIDVNGDGLADHIYAGDMGGQVFRVDLNNGLKATSLVARVKTLAKVAGSGVTGQRRFYEPPTVALFKDVAGKIYAGVGMGSGYRSHPLNEATTDHFFSFFDYDVTRADILTVDSSKLQSTISMTDLAEVQPAASVSVDISGKKGWYISFPDTGEKVITSGVFIFNNLFFSSYVPSVEGGDVCSPVIGRSKLYTVSLASGLPTGIGVKDYSVFGLGGDPQIVALPPQPHGDPDGPEGPLLPEDETEDWNGDGKVDEHDRECSKVAIVTGTDVQKFGGCVTAGLKRTRWYEKTKQE